jgi:hypothetical protein
MVGPAPLPTMALANIDGEARISGAGFSGSGSSSGSGFSGKESSGVFVGSGVGCFWAGACPDGTDFPNLRKPPFVSGFDDLLAASLSRSDIGVLCGSDGDASDFSGCVVEGASGAGVGVGVGVGVAFSPSFFFRAAANAASLETFPPASGAPPSKPSRGYKGSIMISTFRSAGTLSQGESRKKSAAEKCAAGEKLGAGNPGTLGISPGYHNGEQSST